MISWIQNHLIRHGRWIFIALLVVVIIAFVFTIGNMPGLAPRRDAYQAREFYGYDLNSQREMGIVTEAALLSAEMDARPIRGQEELQATVMNRIALLHLADSIGIPAPTEEALSGHLRTRRAFFEPGGTFSRDRYTAFVDRVNNNPRVPQGLIVKVLQDDYRLEQVRDALAGPGYVLPGEVALQVSRNATRYTLNTASLDYDGFEPAIEATTEALRTYYEENAARYEIPERIEATAVHFPAGAFRESLAPATEEELRQHFEANRTRFEADFRAAEAAAEDAEAAAEGTETAAETEAADEEPAAFTFDAVRASVEDDLSKARAMRAAHEAAQAFAYQLYRDSIKRDSPAFAALLEASAAEARAITPFTARARGWEGLPDEMLRAAFSLSADRYYSDAYEMDVGFAVLLYEGRIAPEIPPFEAVEASVRTDFEAAEKRRLFSERGADLRQTLEERLAGGEDFAVAAAELGLSTEAFASFVRSEPPTGLNPSVLEQAESLSEGEVSPMLRVGAEGIFVHVEEKTVPEADPESEAFVEARDYLGRFAAFVGARSLTEELVLRGVPRGDPDQ